MAVSDPSANFGWDVPEISGDVGAWGGILNSIWGEDGDGGATKGIDQVVHEIQVRVDAAEVAIGDIGDRVTVLEAGDSTPLIAQISRATGQSIGKGSNAKIIYNVVDFDSGGLTTPQQCCLTVPADGAGLWQFRAVIQAPASVGSGDDGRFWRVQIVRGSEVIAESRVPYMNDGVHTSNSGDISVEAAAIVVAGDLEVYEVFVQQGYSAGGAGSALVEASVGTYFEGLRLTKEVP